MGLATYLQETKTELKQVKWPSRRQVLVYTAVVIVFSLAVAFILSFFDVIFNFLLKLVLR
ncbi:MAG: preprotein translocase subunit SecE [Candidatus Vogelbacteria bacterium]|nr:preprotein translocase subunit SecE [Candidatus Vogelbacteria bacterium]